MDKANKLRTEIKEKYGPKLLEVVTKDIEAFEADRPTPLTIDGKKHLTQLCWLAIGDFALEQLEKN